MDKCSKTAALYVATLKAMALIHTHNHWTTKGENFYGDHLLFERIYKSALEDLDLAAEKFVGLFGAQCMDYALQTELLNKVLSKYTNSAGDPVSLSLAVEKDFLKLSEAAYECFEEEGNLSLGLDDLVMSIASSREGSVYLLQQASDEMKIKEAKIGNKLLRRLAQAKMPPMTDYLLRAVPLAAANAGVNSVIVTRVDPLPNGAYTVYANVPADKKAAVQVSMDKLFKAQKPELVGKVALMID